MKELFSDIYSKVISFFAPDKNESVKETACNRLKLVLLHDRTKLDPLTLDRMRTEMIEVISRYVVIDTDALDLNLTGDSNSMALMVNIPVLRAKEQHEIDEALKEIDAKSEDVQDETENIDDVEQCVTEEAKKVCECGEKCECEPCECAEIPEETSDVCDEDENTVKQLKLTEPPEPAKSPELREAKSETKATEGTDENSEKAESSGAKPDDDNSKKVRKNK